MTNSSLIESTVVAAHQLSKQVHAPEGVLTLLDNINLKIQLSEAVAILGA